MYQNEKIKSSRLKYTLIDTISECIKVVEEVLLKESIMALDCEGVFLSKEGRLTLIQISLQNEQVFIFDILKGGSLMFLGLDENQRGLKAVLENKKILKLIHDCRNDWDSLLYQYSVRIYNFVDTQEAYFIFKLFYYQEITLPISLMKFIEMMTNVKLEYKQKFKNVMSEDPYMWSNRPLSKEQLAYASEDVMYLIKAWMSLKEKFNENLSEIIFFLTILKVVDFAMFNQFKEYLVASIIYFGMLENIFESKEILPYIFAVDYIYNFLQIKMMTDSKSGVVVKNCNCRNNIENNFEEKETSNCTNCHFLNNNNILPDENFYQFLKDEQTTQSIIKFGINFKEKQRILSLKHYKEEEIKMIDKMNFNLTGKVINKNATNDDFYNEYNSGVDLNNIFYMNYQNEKVIPENNLIKDENEIINNNNNLNNNSNLSTPNNVTNKTVNYNKRNNRDNFYTGNQNLFNLNNNIKTNKYSSQNRFNYNKNYQNSQVENKFISQKSNSGPEYENIKTNNKNSNKYNFKSFNTNSYRNNYYQYYKYNNKYKKIKNYKNKNYNLNLNEEFDNLNLMQNEENINEVKINDNSNTTYIIENENINHNCENQKENEYYLNTKNYQSYNKNHSICKIESYKAKDDLLIINSTTKNKNYNDYKLNYSNKKSIKNEKSENNKNKEKRNSFSSNCTSKSERKASI